MISTVVASVGATLLLMVGIGGGVALYFSRKSPPRRTLPAPPRDPVAGQLEVFGARLGALEALVEALPPVWEEAVKRAKNHSLRAQDSERRVEELVDGSQAGNGDELDAGDVLELDVGGGEGDGVQTVPVGMGGSDVTPELAAWAAQTLGEF